MIMQYRKLATYEPIQWTCDGPNCKSEATLQDRFARGWIMVTEASGITHDYCSHECAIKALREVPLNV